MNLAQALDAARALAAIMVPAFVIGFGAIWLAMHNGFNHIRIEFADPAARTSPGCAVR